MTISRQRQIADTRPRIKQDVLFAQTQKGVLFHNCTAGFHLAAPSAYRIACALVPRLTGESTVAELCDGLTQTQCEMISDVIAAMMDRGFVADVPPAPPGSPRLPAAAAERFAAQVSYVDHYAGQAEERFLTFRSTRVAVLGGDEIARWCALSLLRNGAAGVAAQAPADPGAPVEAELADELTELSAAGCATVLESLPDTLLSWPDLSAFDVVVVTSGTRQLAALASTPVPAGTVLLPAGVIGGRALVGPLSGQDRSGCWVCAALRFGSNGDPGAAAELWSGLVAPRAAANAPSRPLAAMLGNLLAFEVFRLRTAALPPETDGRVIVQNLDSLDSGIEPLLPHPACPGCGEAARNPAATADDELAGLEPRTPVLASADDAGEAEELFDELIRRSLLVSPTVGVFTAFDDDTITQLPLKVGRIRFGLGHTVRRTITAFDIHHVVGARLSALNRAAEAYAAQVAAPAGHEPALGRSLGESPCRSLGESLGRSLGESPRIAVHRLAIAAGNAPRDAPGGPWIAATSLLTRGRVLLPAAAVHPLGPANRDGWFLPTAAGSGAGRSPGEALGRALGTALAHDAISAALRHDRAVRRVSRHLLDGDRELAFLAGTADLIGLDLELLDLSMAEAPVRVLLARADDGADGPLWACAADPGWARAAREALCEVVGRAQAARELPGDPLDLGDPLIRDLDPYTLAITDEDIRQPATVATWDAVLDELRAEGRDALALTTGPADLLRAGLSVVRVVLANRE
jgi:bacteriocin biosynthesis cyclodehydratase domain-containing protein